MLCTTTTVLTIDVAPPNPHPPPTPTPTTTVLRVIYFFVPSVIKKLTENGTKMYMNYAKYTFNSVWYLHSDSTSDEVGSWFDATLAGSRCAIRLMHSVKSVIAQPKTSADQQARKVDTEDRACHAAYDKITHRIKPPVDCFIVHLYLRFIPLLIPPLVRLFTKKGRG